MHKLFHQYNMKAIKILDFEHAHLRKMLEIIFSISYIIIFLTMFGMELKN